MKDLGVSYEKPRGGVYIWLKLPKGVDSRTLSSLAYSRGLSVIPGHYFYPDKKEGVSHIRICYSHESPDRLEKGMDVLSEVLKELLATGT